MADKNRAVPRLGDFGPERERIVREYASGNPLKTFADRASEHKDPGEEKVSERPGDENADRQ